MDPYDFACARAVEAGEMAVQLRREDLETGLKGGNTRDILTSADTAVSAFLVSQIRAAFPDHGIYSEEGGGVESASAFMWALDPIDGTANYARSIPRYCVSVGLLEGGVPVAGAVYDPNSRELFSFKKGGGAYLNGEPIRVSAVPRLQDAYVAFSPGSRNPALYDWAGSSYRKLLEFARKRSLSGASALDFCYVAAGRIDAGVFGMLTLLDIAAAVGILFEAGGVLATKDGNPVSLSALSERIFIANSAAMEAELRALID
jgi:myo-inositol-1(or 4)-monophosphatase